MKHQITNDLKLDAIKDNFTPPSWENVEEDALKELFHRLNLDYSNFFDYVYKNSEYYTEKGKKYFLVKDVAKIILQQTKSSLE